MQFFLATCPKDSAYVDMSRGADRHRLPFLFCQGCAKESMPCPQRPDAWKLCDTFFSQLRSSHANFPALYCLSVHCAVAVESSCLVSLFLLFRFFFCVAMILTKKENFYAGSSKLCKKNPCNLKVASACCLFVCICGLLRSFAYFAESCVWVLESSCCCCRVMLAVVVLSFFVCCCWKLLQSAHCFMQTKQRLKRNSINRSLRELAEVAFEFTSYRCERCSRIQHGGAQCVSWLILCCCSYGNFFHASLSYVLWIGNGAVAGLHISLVLLSCALSETRDVVPVYDPISSGSKRNSCNVVCYILQLPLVKNMIFISYDVCFLMVVSLKSQV